MNNIRPRLGISRRISPVMLSCSLVHSFICSCSPCSISSFVCNEYAKWTVQERLGQVNGSSERNRPRESTESA